jgi:poly(3-hydroxyalkanoate) synthetase
MGLWAAEAERFQRYLRVALPAEKPEACWATPNRKLRVTGNVTLRVFGKAKPGDTPVLIVTPQVNHSYIADFSQSQSLVRTLMGAGVSRVVVTDWADPDPSARYGMADSIDDLAACVKAVGGSAHVVGLCQGGWQAAILAALEPELVKSLTVAAAPIDPHAGSTALHAFTFGLPQAFFEAVVQAGGGVAPGALIAQGFDLLKPFERLFFNYAALYLNLDDAAYVKRYQDLRNWYRLNKNVAGDLYLEVVRDLFKENKLARGELTLRGRRVDLSSIRCPIHLLAGTRDHITPAEQVWALEAIAKDAPVTRHEVDAGHIGVFMGRGALTTVWPEIAKSFL